MTTHVFILVHGTFAPDAKWTSEESALRRALASAFPQANVIAFRWSGSNTHSARLAAARDLQDVILAAARNFPRTKIHLIAHSHGGNIAYYACRDGEVERRVTSIVCIATPFIICGLANLDWIAFRLYVVFAALVVGGMMLAYLLVARNWHWSLSFIAIGLITWVSHVIIEDVRIRATPKWLQAFEARQKAISDRLRLPTLSIPVLIVRTTRDEASIWLRASHLASTVPHLLNRLAFWLAVSGLAGLISAYYLGLLPNAVREPVAIYTAWVGVFIAVLASYLMMFGVTFLVRSNPIVFGWEGLADSLFVALTVWTAPAFMPFTYHDVKLGGFRPRLRHSALYDDRSVLDLLPIWVRHADAGPTA